MRVLVCGLLLLATSSVLGQPAKHTHVAKMSYLDNGTINVGVDLNLGGAITYLAAKGQENMVNNWDWGRQIQMSHYAGPVPFHVGEQKPSKHWAHLGWNPVQAGDDFRHPSRVLESTNDGRELFVKCLPMQWPLKNVPADCTFETRLKLDGPCVHVRCKVIMQRHDRTPYPARMQELPAIYVNGPYHRLHSYTGDKPWTNDRVQQITYTPKPEAPWTSWLATEQWAAQVNDDGFGLGVYHPTCVRFSGGFAGKAGRGGTHDSSTGYIAPNRIEILDHNGTFEHEYWLIVGSLETIRREAVKHAKKPTPPNDAFATDRCGWYYQNATDAGWPIRDELHIRLTQADPQIISQARCWFAKDAPTLYIRAAFTGKDSTAQVFWSTLEQSGFNERRSTTFTLRGGGEWQTYAIPLGKSSTYQGMITGLRIDPVPAGKEGWSLRVRSIGFAQPAE